MEDIDIDKGFYFPICNKSEIDRIFNVQTAKDYLLKLRADTIVDHMRLFRVYRNKAIALGQSWALEKSFSDSHYSTFIDILPNDLKIECDKLTYGNIFSNESNGLLFKTDYGPITTLSDSLIHFLEFMHLGLMDFGEVVPEHVRFNAIRIAIRVMLQTESLDFLMDPRGIIPTKIQKVIQKPVNSQMKFIAGHECSHFLLKHLSDSNVSRHAILRAVSSIDEDYKPMNVYTTSQKQELEADLASINMPNYSWQEKKMILEAALLWFACLDIFESVEDSIFPPIGYQTHPSARDRYFNLLENVNVQGKFDRKYWEKRLPPYIDFYRRFFIEDVSLNIESYEMYGSVYLDKPNTEWRGRELIDRVDYY